MLTGMGTLEELWVLLQTKMKTLSDSHKNLCCYTTAKSEWISFLTLRLCKSLSLRERGEFI